MIPPGNTGDNPVIIYFQKLLYLCEYPFFASDGINIQIRIFNALISVLFGLAKLILGFSV